ncbi:hypothetical protein ACFU99_04485 [Streptomyces sp. NPDC057654]|uniref:hypothetical protein n=1 Tax=Streptomyces sp. NPDC057654 TaxID=3346196 RepID=UPI0036A6CC56
MYPLPTDTAGNKKLDYSVEPAPPLPLEPGHTGQQLLITVHNPQTDLVVCEQLIFALTADGTEKAVTDQDHLADIHYELPPYWNKKTSGKGTFVFAPEKKAQRIPSQEKLNFALTAITVSSTPGDGLVQVCEKIKGSPQGPWENHLLPKLATGFTVRNFRPNRLSVPAGQEVTVSWDVHGRTDETLALAWTGSNEEHSEDVTRDSAWKTACTKDTAFELGVTKTKDLKCSLFTFVTVTEPLIHVNNLTVSRRAMLLTAPRPGAHEDPLTPDLTTTANNKVTRTYTADTDGLLIGSLQTFSPTATAELTITIKPPTGNTHTSITRVTGDHDEPYDPGTPVAVPVPADSTLTITWNLQDTKLSTAQVFRPALRWQPLGTGTLRLQDHHTPLRCKA